MRLTKKLAAVRKRALALLAGVAGLILVACGGGGGDTNSQDPGGNDGVTLSGRLWHNNSVLNDFTGSQIAYTDSRSPVLLDGNESARPWPDGTQYAVNDYAVFDEYTDVNLIDTASGAVRYSLRFNGYARNLRPSPVDKTLMLVTWGDDSVAPSSELVVDFAQGMVLVEMDSADGVVNWLPDGRYLRVSPDGDVAVAHVGDSFATTGHLAVPDGREVGQFWINRQGTQMVTRMVVYDNAGGVDETDLWISTLDGASLERLTHTGITSYARWSPDGKRVAFDVDTGSVCDFGGCGGTCSLWHAASTAREVQALPSSGDALHFTVKNTRGEDQVLGCHLMAWTD